MTFPDKDTRYLFEGVYAVSVKETVDSAAYFRDWVFLRRPYIDKVWKLATDEYYVLVAFSGTPPSGQALFVRIPSYLGEHIHYVQQTHEASLIEAGVPHPLVVLQPV